MKNRFLLLISIIMVACSTQKVLKTDTQKNIDLSGKWNETDAEIATNELFNNLITSSWLANYKADNPTKARIKVLEFESNFDQSNLSMKNYFSKYLKANQQVEYIGENTSLKHDFILGGSINAEEFITDEQNYIDYILKTHLKDLDGQTLWEDNTVVKKYIKD